MTSHIRLLISYRIDDYLDTDVNRNMWSEGWLTKIKQLPDLIICCQKMCPVCGKQLNERKGSNGLSRNRSLTVRER